MMRLLCLVVAAPLLVAGSADAGQAEAAPTCQGRPATIVGQDYVDVVGTEGDDVIVSGGSQSIEALGGDDLICAAGNDPFLEIDAGPGEDVVDTTASLYRVVTDLGTGADRFAGGPKNDQVSDGERDEHGDPARDVIDTGAGLDIVDTGSDALPNDDDIDLGTGGGGVDFHGAPGGTAHLQSGGSALISFFFGEPVGTLRVDNRHGSADLDGVPLVSWNGFGDFSTYFSDVQRLILRGGDGPEGFTVSAFDHPAEIDARTGGGTDDLTISWLDVGTIDGGRGRDMLSIFGNDATVTGQLDSDITADLGSGLVRIDPLEGEARSLSVDGIEDLSVFNFRRATLRGDRGANLLDVRAGCRTTLVGRGGADLLQRFSTLCNDGWLPASTMRGDQGPDRLLGHSADDLMVGGPGRDVANGRGGTDTCRTEVRRSCELR
jgi:hypothetical protein